MRTQKRFLPLVLALVLALSLALPAAAAGEVTPAGFTLFRLSAKPVGGYVPTPDSFLVVEDGTRLTCPGAEMSVVRYNITTAEDSFLPSLSFWLNGYGDESTDWKAVPQTVKAGQALTIEGKAAYVVKASAGDVSEELWIINRSTVVADVGPEETLEDSYGFYHHTTPSGVQKLERRNYILTTAQPEGLGVGQVTWSMEDGSGGTARTSVYDVFPKGTVLYAPEGFYFTYHYTDLYAMGTGGDTSDRLDFSGRSDSNLLEFGGTLLAYGNPNSIERVDILFSDYGGKTDWGKWTLTRLTEDQLTGNHQYASSWALPQVNQAIDAGLMTYGDYANLQSNACRGEFAALAVRLYETITGETAPLPETSPFEDTEDQAVLKANALGLINGVSGTRFAAYDNLTREQAATILARLAEKVGYKLPAQALAFDDKGSVSSWAADAVGGVSAAGIMNGIGGNRFDPKGVFTREQAVLTVLRMYEQAKK